MRAADGVLEEGAWRVHLHVAHPAVPPTGGDVGGANAAAAADDAAADAAASAPAAATTGATATTTATATANAVPPRRRHGRRTGVMGGGGDDLARVRAATMVFRPCHWPADRHAADAALIVAGEEARAWGGERGGGGRGSHAAAAVAAATDRGKEAGWGLLLFPTERADERPTASTAATRACNPSRVDNWEPKGRGGASAPRMDGHGHGRCQSQRRVGTRTLKRCGPRGVRRHAERHMMVSDPRAGPAFSPRRINDSNANQTVATREGLPTTFTSSVMDFRDENDLCGVPL